MSTDSPHLQIGCCCWPGVPSRSVMIMTEMKSKWKRNDIGMNGDSEIKSRFINEFRALAGIVVAPTRRRRFVWAIHSRWFNDSPLARTCRADAYGFFPVMWVTWIWNENRVWNQTNESTSVVLPSRSALIVWHCRKLIPIVVVSNQTEIVAPKLTSISSRYSQFMNGRHSTSQLAKGSSSKCDMADISRLVFGSSHHTTNQNPFASTWIAFNWCSIWQLACDQQTNSPTKARSFRHRHRNNSNRSDWLASVGPNANWVGCEFATQFD